MERFGSRFNKKISPLPLPGSNAVDVRDPVISLFSVPGFFPAQERSKMLEQETPSRCSATEVRSPGDTRIMSEYYVYILASKKNGTLYIGLTNDIERRMLEHKNKIFKGFSAKYEVNMLVYFEEIESYSEAITREKQMKKWKRLWKLNLIEKDNPNWEDLSKEWFD